MITTNIEIGWNDSKLQSRKPIQAIHILKSDHFRKSVQHLSIEIGARRSWSHAYRLVRRISRLARIADRHGIILQIHTSNQTTAPPPWDKINGLGVEVRGIKDGDILWDTAIYSGGIPEKIMYRLTGSSYSCHATHAGVLFRALMDRAAE